MNQLNKVREMFSSYEHKRYQLIGLDDLNTGLDILIDYIESNDMPDKNITAKNMFITYQKNSIEWIKGILENCFGSNSELPQLIYCKKVVETFEDANKVIDPESEFIHLKQSIKLRIAEIMFPDSIVSAIRKLPDEEQEPAFSLLERLDLLPTKKRVRGG